MSTLSILFLVYVAGFIPMAFVWAKDYRHCAEVDRPLTRRDMVLEILIYQFSWPLTLPIGWLYHRLLRRNSHHV